MVKIIFLFINFFIRIYSEIINNPISFVYIQYPIVLSTPDDDYYYLMTDKKQMKIDKNSGEIVDEIDETFDKLSESLYIADKNYNNYLININDKNFVINYAPFLNLTEITIDSLNFDGKDEVKIMGSIGQDEDFIIYGFYKYEIFFSSKSQRTYSLVTKGNYQNPKLSCKFLKEEFYICAGIFDGKVELNIFKYGNNSLTFYSGIVLEYENKDEVYLYDAFRYNIKILCLKYSGNIKCDFLIILDFREKQGIDYELINKDKINFNSSYSFSEDNCYFSKFNSEYLFCCAKQDDIICYRINRTNL